MVDPGAHTLSLYVPPRFTLSFTEPSLEVVMTLEPFRYTSTLDHDVYVQESRIELEPSCATLSVGAPPVDGGGVVPPLVDVVTFHVNVCDVLNTPSEARAVTA